MVREISCLDYHNPNALLTSEVYCADFPTRYKVIFFRFEKFHFCKVNRTGIDRAFAGVGTLFILSAG